jgi:cytochrome c
MPLGTRFDSPFLTDDEAYDVAGYIVIANGTANLFFLDARRDEWIDKGAIITGE